MDFRVRPPKPGRTRRSILLSSWQRSAQYGTESVFSAGRGPGILGGRFRVEPIHPGRFVQQMPGPDVHRFGRQVHRLRRSDRQRRPAALPQVQCEAAPVRTLPGRDHGEGRGRCRRASRPIRCRTSRTAAMLTAATHQGKPHVRPRDRAGRRSRNPAKPDERLRPRPRVPKSTRCRPSRRKRKARRRRRICRRADTAGGVAATRSGSRGQAQADQSGQGGHVYVGKVALPVADSSPGTRSEGRWGWLTYDGQKLPRGDVNDYYNTPWGPMYWVDVPTTAWGLHGWMPVPLAQNRRQGRALTAPISTLAAAPTQPGTAATGIPGPPPPPGPPRRQARGYRRWKSTSRTTASWPGCGSAMFS